MANEPVTMPTTTLPASRRLQDRLTRETRAEVYFDRGSAGSTPPTPACTRSSRWAWSCPGPPTTWSTAVRIAAEEGVPVLPRGAATSLSGQTVGPAIVIDFSKYLNRIGVVDRDRDDRPGRAGGRARPAQRAPEAARPDVRAGRLDERPRHDRRHDRQQLGRCRLAALRQDGRSRPVGRGRPRRRHARDASGRSRTPSWTPVCARADLVGAVHRDGARHRGAAPRGDRGPVPAGSSAGSAATTSTSSSPACRSAPVGWTRRALAVQPRPADRRLGGDAGGRHRGRAEGRPAPAGAGAGRPFVRDDPRGARPARRRSSRPARWPSRCSTG